jgi:hypothetical protein
MYNKPITQRVAAARSGKCSPMKQTNTTVLNEEIPDAVMQSPDTVIEGTSGEAGTSSKGTPSAGVTKFKRCCPGGPTGKNSTVGGDCEGYSCGDAGSDFDPCTEIDCGAGEKKIKSADGKSCRCDKEGTDGTPDQIKPGEKANLYMYDKADAISSYGQRLKTRGMLQGDRKAGKLARKAYDSMSNKERAEALGINEYSTEFSKIKNKRQFGRAIKAQESARSFKAQQKLNETQRKANEQGITTGRTGMVKGSFVDPQSGRKMGMTDLSPKEQQDLFNKRTTAEDTAKANKKQNDAAAVEAAKKAENDKKRQNAKAAGNMKYQKPSMLKMKGAFKMSGYGSKMLKK